MFFFTIRLISILFSFKSYANRKQIQKTFGIILSDFLSDVILIFSRITRCEWKFIIRKNSSSTLSCHDLDTADG